MSEAFEIQGLEEFRQRLGAIGNEKQLARVATNAVRRGARRIAAATRKEQKGRGVLARIFKNSADDLGKLIHAHRPEVVGGVIQCVITVKGLAAIQEQGLRTAPHMIRRPWGRKVPAMHPGAQHPQMPSFPGQFAKGTALTLEDFRKSFEDYITKAWANG